MSKITVETFAGSAACDAPEGFSGQVAARSYFNEETDPIRLQVFSVKHADRLRIEASAIDRLAYVWKGEAEAGGRELTSGSSLIVEHGATLEIIGRAEVTMIVMFAASQPPANQRQGGHLHFLPFDNVPRVTSATFSGVLGGLHANGKCSTCDLWLNENSLPGQSERPPEEEEQKGVHAHPENEIIFVTEGQIRLGSKLHDSGTALAIDADTFYGFSPGPDGMSFITFRPSRTTQIRFASGGDYIHSTFWDHVDELEYLEPVSA